jgi:hypothetical protein
MLESRNSSLLRKASPKKALEFFRPKLLKKALEGPSIVSGSGKAYGVPKIDTLQINFENDGTIAAQNF